MSDEAATKADLAQAMADLRAQMATKADLAELKAATKAELAELKRELLLEIGHAISVGVEQFGKLVGVVEEKYRDLPPLNGSSAG